MLAALVGKRGRPRPGALAQGAVAATPFYQGMQDMLAAASGALLGRVD